MDKNYLLSQNKEKKWWTKCTYFLKIRKKRWTKFTYFGDKITFWRKSKKNHQSKLDIALTPT
jgi:hypothetical protein